MSIFVIALLLVSAHFSLTAFVPTEAGKAWIGWPFAADSRSWLGPVAALPAQSGATFIPIIAGIAGLSFLGAAASLFGWLVPAHWWTPLVLAGSVASIVLYLSYFSLWALIPLALDAILLWGVLVQGWSIPMLRGA